MIHKLSKEHKVGVHRIVFKFFIVELLAENTGHNITNKSGVWQGLSSTFADSKLVDTVYKNINNLNSFDSF